MAWPYSGQRRNLPPRSLTDEDYERLIAPSDDLQSHQTAFISAARWQIEAGTCGENDLRSNGGWLTSRSRRDRPIYFTYCRGSPLADRIYFNAKTLEFYGRAIVAAKAVWLVET